MKKALYRKRICAEKEKLTPEKVFHTPQYRDLLTSIGHEITGGKLTTLRLYDDKNSGIAGWNQGETVAVNLGNQITASFLTLELKSDSLIGILGHECGHYRYTDSALRKVCRAYVKWQLVSKGASTGKCTGKRGIGCDECPL